MKQQNIAARDLWAQMFERVAADLSAVLHDPVEDGEATQHELTTHALKEVGWSEAEIERRIQSDRLYGDLENPNSPGVGPSLEHRLNVLADRVRKVLSEIGGTSHEKVEIAIDPVVGVSASPTNVIMTGEGMLSISAFPFKWCELVARAYTRTLYADVAHWTLNASNPAGDRELLLSNPDLVLYWFRIFVSFSGAGTHIFVPFRPSSPTEFHLFEQVAWSMEYFTVAHDFGHQVLGHRDVNDDLRELQFRADAIAVKVCERFEFEPFPLLSNPYTRTGAGGSLMLLALEILRAFEDRANDGAVRAETHPTASDRIDKVSTRNLMMPKQLEMDKEFNGTVAQI